MNDVREPEYVTLEIHNLQLERIELLMERNLARQEAIASEMKAQMGELKGEIGTLRGEVKALDTKIDSVERRLDARIDGLQDSLAITNMRIEDLKSSQSIKLSKWGILVAVGICALQILTTVVLHFWH